MPAKVYLVGYGPGDPELLTLKGLAVLKQAQIIFHDDLVDTQFLQQFKVPHVYVGKRKGQHSFKQNQINQLLYEAACNYQIVVRLKGGDPFIFGRGGEELSYLKKMGIETHVIPGITAASAAAASAQIPLTHRGIARALTFLPAHHLDSKPLPIPREGTLAIYMGASKLADLKAILSQGGLLPQTPVALIHAASLVHQTIHRTDLENLDKTSLPSPLLVLVGPVCKENFLDDI